MAEYFLRLTVTLALMAAACLWNLGCATTRDIVETVTFQKQDPIAPAEVEPVQRAEKTVRSVSIAYTSSGGIAGRIVERFVMRTADLEPQAAMPLDYVVEEAFAPRLVEVLRRHGFFNWRSLKSVVSDGYTATLQVVVDGVPTTVTMDTTTANPMQELLEDLKQTVRGHYVSQLPAKGLCAHRGAKHSRPENTLAAFREAVRLGAAMVELDVQRTADGTLVIMHDPTVDRTTNGKGKVEALTFNVIRSLDAGVKTDARFAGEKVPTLEEALRVMPRNIWLNVHLKGDAAIGGEAAKVIAAHDRLHQAFLAATKEQAESARAAVGGVMICNMSRQKETARYVEETVAMKADFIQLLQRGPAFTAGHIARLREAKVRINCYGTDDPAVVSRLMGEGVEFVLTDDLEAARAGVR